jgi:Metallo-peptidase family M12B Reprolysin-like
MKKLHTFLVPLLLLASGSLMAQTSTHWKDIPEPNNALERSTREIVPGKYRVVSLDLNGTSSMLKKARKGHFSDARAVSMLVDLPMPDGSMQQFSIVESSIMEPGLEAKYPGIKTYSGVGVTDPTSTVWLDITYKGYHAMILSEKGDIFIDPYSQQSQRTYISYRKADYTRTDKMLNCGTEARTALSPVAPVAASRVIQGQLRSYRLALAATVEYTNYHGGTKPLALSAMVTSINRVNAVYQVDLGIKMNLVANTDLLIYTGNANRDPYSNTNGSRMLSQNINNINSVIGSANYDIGHVFSTGGGGVAYLGSVCTSIKAGGVTGSPAPVGDPFDIDYVAHEIGHQFGAEHTFNAVSGNCSGGNRSAASAYEPGSGVTIMAYAGICGINNLAPNSIAFFHVRSLDQIYSFVTTGAGAGCAVVTTNTNVAPVISSIGTTYNIPVNTPFTLTAAATDADGDPVTYSWEEFDLGPAGDWNLPSGNAPIFRPRNATASGTRSFPILANVLNNSNTIGELKPSYARAMNFKVTVRDGRGGVSWNDNNVVVNVINTTTPFAVTGLDAATTLTGGASQTITWNVSGTTAAPISTANVNILLSTDGGQTFGTVLASNVPNSGSAAVTIPNVSTTTGRIKIEGAGNIFYDINNANLTVVPSAITRAAVSDEGNKAAAVLSVYPNPASGAAYIRFSALKSGVEQLIITDINGRVIRQQPIAVQAGENNRQFALPTSGSGNIYFITVGRRQPVRLVVQ